MVQGSTIIIASLVLLLAPFSASAEDWPQFLGPNGNGTYSGPPISEDWGKDGPPVVWQRSSGEGFSSPVVCAGKLILFHRVEAEELVECLDAKTGKLLWKFAYPTKFSDGIRLDSGPRATPAISDGKVYTHGAEGMLHCLDLATGNVIWKSDTRAQFKPERKWHGVITSPLIEGNALLLMVGSTNHAGVVAFNKTDGAVLWQSSDDKFSGSSPVCATIDGHRYAFFITRSHLLALNPADGKVAFQYPWQARDQGAVIAASPVVIGDQVFISAIYEMGATLLRVKDNQFEKLWASDEALSTHYVTGVCRDGFIYGLHGHQSVSPSLRCIEWKTGKVRWENRDVGGGNMLLVNDSLLVLTLRGELMLAPASPKEFKIKTRAQILPFLVRAYPALADGFLYARSKQKLVCLDLRPKTR